jgi:glycerol-3-phosphate dehydrogenase
MEPWDVKETRERLQKMSGQESVVLMAKLSDECLQILKDSIRAEGKYISRRELLKRMDELLWKREAWLMALRSKK